MGPSSGTLIFRRLLRLCSLILILKPLLTADMSVFSPLCPMATVKACSGSSARPAVNATCLSLGNSWYLLPSSCCILQAKGRSVGVEDLSSYWMPASVSLGPSESCRVLGNIQLVAFLPSQWGAAARMTSLYVGRSHSVLRLHQACNWQYEPLGLWQQLIYEKETEGDSHRNCDTAAFKKQGKSPNIKRTELQTIIRVYR